MARRRLTRKQKLALRKDIVALHRKGLTNHQIATKLAPKYKIVANSVMFHIKAVLGKKKNSKGKKGKATSARTRRPSAAPRLGSLVTTYSAADLRRAAKHAKEYETLQTKHAVAHESIRDLEKRHKALSRQLANAKRRGKKLSNRMKKLSQ